KMSEGEIGALGTHLGTMRALTEAHQQQALVRANSEFHRHIRAGSRNPFVEKFVEALRPFDLSVRERALSVAEEARRGYEEHAAIFAALERRDGEAAERSMREHILRTVREVLAHEIA